VEAFVFVMRRAAGDVEEGQHLDAGFLDLAPQQEGGRQLASPCGSC